MLVSVYWSPDPNSRETIADKGVTYPLDGNLLVMFAMCPNIRSIVALVIFMQSSISLHSETHDNQNSA